MLPGQNRMGFGTEAQMLNWLEGQQQRTVSQITKNESAHPPRDVADNGARKIILPFHLAGKVRFETISDLQ